MLGAKWERTKKGHMSTNIYNQCKKPRVEWYWVKISSSFFQRLLVLVTLIELTIFFFFLCNQLMFLLPGFKGRNLLQTDNVSEPIRQSDDTVRVDPLDSFKKYRGGYNITNKHYWSVSV